MANAPSNSLNDLMLAEYSARQSSSVVNHNFVAAPAGLTDIVVTGSLSAGTYEIEAVTYVSGTTVAANDENNMVLFVGGSPFLTLLTPVPGTTGSSDVGRQRVRAKLATAGIVGIQSGAAAATAGSTYYGTVVVTRIS